MKRGDERNDDMRIRVIHIDFMVLNPKSRTSVGRGFGKILSQDIHKVRPHRLHRLVQLVFPAPRFANLVDIHPPIQNDTGDLRNIEDLRTDIIPVRRITVDPVHVVVFGRLQKIQYMRFAAVG
ncbi:MAG: hypothetical protein HKL90_05265 [Elusimicrobia bacterium]|nr:hypothetical protein [Elusimicrobiota bacterium]